MVIITEKELEDNFDYYLSLSSKEDVCIERNGLKIALLTNPESYASLKKNYSNEQFFFYCFPLQLTIIVPGPEEAPTTGPNGTTVISLTLTCFKMASLK